MKTNNVKRTRRHVVVRMTPAQAQAWARQLAGMPVEARPMNQLRDLAHAAAAASTVELPAKANPTSFPRLARELD